MNWDGYTIFSILSGLVMLLVALLGRDIGMKGRAMAFAGGVFFAGYGVYVASQTSGTFYFPIWIFVIPFLGVASLVFPSLNRTSQSTDRPAQVPDASGSSSTTTSGKPAKWICPDCRNLLPYEARARHPQDCDFAKMGTVGASHIAASVTAAKWTCPDCDKIVAAEARAQHPRECCGFSL
jgi:hypothetical protein